MTVCRKLSLAILFTTALTFGLTGCGGDSDDSPGTQSSAEPCSGDECAAKQKEADTKMASCDYAAAYEALDSVYAAQLKDDKVDAQTALDRSILGLIHIFYRPEVQAILPKLGFIAKSGLVDFKPMWSGAHGIFKEAFTANHNYEGIEDLIPMKIFTNQCEDEDDCGYWFDTIDKTLTIDAVLDVLVGLKPELESLAGSLEAAAKITGGNALTPNAKCGFENVKFDAADLETFAAMIMAADAAIDLLSRYDFNFSIYDLFNINYSDSEDYELSACDVELYEERKVDTCKDEASLDYKTLTCYPLDNYDKELKCVIPNDSTYYKDRAASANKIIPHLFRASTSKRKSAGLAGDAAFKKAASLFLSALDNSAKGKFFDYSSIPAGALSDMKDIATEIANGTADFSKFVQPSLKLDLNKLFKDILVAKDGDFKIDFSEDGTYPYGDAVWVGNIAMSVFGEEIFLNQSLINYIFDAKIISHYTFVSQYLYDIEINFSIDSWYDATFADDWEDMSMTNWINPNEYLGLICEDGDYCEERCPDENKPYYIRDSSNPKGFICSACWEKCEGETPYCYVDERNRLCSAIETCPTNYTISFDGKTCVPKEGTSCPDGLLENEICSTVNHGSYFSESVRYYCNVYGSVELEYQSGVCKSVDISALNTDRKTIYVIANEYNSCSEESLEKYCTTTNDDREAVAYGSGCMKASDNTMVEVNLDQYELYSEICSASQTCSWSENICVAKEY